MQSFPSTPVLPSGRAQPQRYRTVINRSAKYEPRAFLKRSTTLSKNTLDRTLRAFATITSCPNSLSKRLIQGGCVPISSAIRLRGMQGFRSRTDSLLRRDSEYEHG